MVGPFVQNYDTATSLPCRKPLCLRFVSEYCHYFSSVTVGSATHSRLKLQSTFLLPSIVAAALNLSHSRSELPNEIMEQAAAFNDNSMLKRGCLIASWD